MPLLKILSQQKPLFDSARLNGLGVIISAVTVSLAIFAPGHTLKNIDYEEVFAVVERTRPELIALALLVVIISYASLTVCDLFALRRRRVRALSSEADTGSRQQNAARQKARSPVLIPSKPEISTPAN